MNAQQYRKQLLLQRIESHRERVDLEIQYLKDANPLRPILDFGHEVAGIFTSLGGVLKPGAAGSKGRARMAGLDLAALLPLVIQAISMLLRKRKARA